MDRPTTYSDSASDSAARNREIADQRMADLAVFTDGLVHDLRNPLNVIRTNLYLLRQRMSAEDERVERAVERIDNQVTAALHILDGIQAFYRADRPEFQHVEVNEVVRRVAETYALPEEYTIHLQLADGLPRISADPQLLDPALRALIRNAAEAMTGGGAICVRTCLAADHIGLQVEDSGPGVPAEVPARVFEPFFTTRRGHAGLGLALVDKVARAHRGRACLKTREGGGTQAVLELPL